MNSYYTKWISENEVHGKWNVIQVIDGVARYFVLMCSELKENPETYPFLGQGWIETDSQGTWYTEGEDPVLLEQWEKHEGVLIPFP